MNNKKLTKVIQDPKDPVTVELLATSIRDIAAGMKAINGSALNRRAMLVLLKDSSGVPLVQIEKVLSALNGLERNYLR